MKKILACMLALMLLLGAATPALSQEPDGSLDFLATAVVTAIEAEWNGTVNLFDTWRLFPYSLSRENIDVTLYFEDHEPMALDQWHDVTQGRVAWRVWSLIDEETNIVTVYFRNTHYQQAFEEAHGTPWSEDYLIFNATLPQTSFEVLDSWAEIYVRQHSSIPALSLGQRGNSPHELYTFTPQRSGQYYVRGANLWTNVVILNSRFEEIAREKPYNFAYFSIYLQQGETYYIFNSTRDVLIDDSLRPLTLRLVSEYLSLAFVIFAISAIVGFFLSVGILLSPINWLLNLFR